MTETLIAIATAFVVGVLIGRASMSPPPSAGMTSERFNEDAQIL